MLWLTKGQHSATAHGGASDDTVLLREGTSALGIDLNAEQLRQFRRYYAELTAWNRRINLTAITDWRAAQTLHFVDSLTVATAIAPSLLNGGALLDVGSGGGFPGIPLRLAYTGLRVTLLDATAKKTAFLSHVCAELGLTDVRTLTGRAETLAHDAELRERFDIVAARAVAPIAVLAELTLPFARIGGTVVMQKTADISAELRRAQDAIATLGGRALPLTPLSLPHLGDGRALLALEKTHSTPPQFPRRPGMPAKRPLTT